MYLMTYTDSNNPSIGLTTTDLSLSVLVQTAAKLTKAGFEGFRVWSLYGSIDTDITATFKGKYPERDPS